MFFLRVRVRVKMFRVNTLWLCLGAESLSLGFLGSVCSLQVQPLNSTTHLVRVLKVSPELSLYVADYS